MKFREHRESLEDALKTVVEISPTREALLKYINKIYNKNLFDLVKENKEIYSLNK